MLLATDPESAGGGGRRRALAALEPAVVFVAALAVLIAASRGFGLTWDEATYFRYADSIRAWWAGGAPLDAPSLQRYWAYDVYANPHPPFLRILAALGAPIATRWLRFPSDYRFAHFVWVAGLLAGIYALLRRRWSAFAALTAVGFVALQARVFGHLLIAAQDSPTALAWLLLLLLAWRLSDDETDAARGRRRTAPWLAFFAVAGCAAASKFTGFLALVPAGTFFLWRRRWRDAGLVVAAGAWALAFVVMTSPQHWHHPIQGAVEYLSYPLQRQAAPFTVAYFGRLYGNDLPWHYFLVMSAITVPPLIVALLPPAVLARGEARRLLAPIGFALGFWLLLVHLPNTPRHDEVRQFLSVYPLLGIVAWIGLLSALQRIAASRPAWGAPRVTTVACAACAVVLGAAVARAHPFELSTYNGFIGGVRGAERAGMELSLYFEAVDRGTLRALERYPKPGETLAMAPFWPTLLASYVEHGGLRSPLTLLPQQTSERPDWLLLLRRRYVVDEGFYLAAPAVHEVSYDGVSLVKVVRLADVGKRARAGR